jgi:glycyl-tRNA synthetase beta chain
MTGELLLELLTEEIPARMQRRAIDDLTSLIADKLKAADIPTATIEGQVTPRRLVVIADGIPARQPDRSEERRGPRVGAPEAAINGFLRSAGLASTKELETRGEFHFAVINRPGRATAEVLPELILAAMTALPWPKSMRYPASPLRWVRPLNSVVCLLDGEVINLALGEVPVGRVTRGHRFLAPGEITVENAADYRAKLAHAHVVLDRAERRATIDEGLTALAHAAGLEVKADEGLLEEVTGLVEYPVVLMGNIDADFVRPLPEGLPPEVLATAMRTHQKYFTCLNPDGTPAPRFLFVANNVTPDRGETIAAGNERVLRARLSDARFFWDQDRKVRLEGRVEALKQRVYHEKLGSVYERTGRVERLAEAISQRVPGADLEHVRRAVRLAKADLSSGMVGEFPELQGVMGRYYALYGDQKEAPQVAEAIGEQYKPLGPGDTCPTTPEGTVLAIADKLDALVSFFVIDEKPTGSRDPFALRRAALGIVRIILENKLRFGLRSALEAAASSYLNSERVPDEVLDFIAERLKVHLRDQGVRHDLASAVFSQVEDRGLARITKIEDNLVRLLARVAALQAFLDTDDGANLLTAYRRAANIVAIEERKDRKRYHDAEYQEMPGEPVEGSLSKVLAQVRLRVEELVAEQKFEDAMAALATLRKPVDEFFDRVTVNVDDKQLRENRLRLLARIRATMNQIADFSQVEG